MAVPSIHFTVDHSSGGASLCWFLVYGCSTVAHTAQLQSCGFALSGAVDMVVWYGCALITTWLQVRQIAEGILNGEESKQDRLLLTTAH